MANAFRLGPRFLYSFHGVIRLLCDCLPEQMDDLELHRDQSHSLVADHHHFHHSVRQLDQI